MIKHLSHRAIDAAFAFVAEKGDLLVVCHGAPALDRDDEDNDCTILGSAMLRPGLDGGDYLVEPGTTSGRRLVVARREAVPITRSGYADHVAILEGTTSLALLVSPLQTPVWVTADGEITVESFSDEIGDPF